MHKTIKLTPILDSIQFIDMTDEEYFSPKWSGYISNSKLKDINPQQGGNPEKFFAPMQSLSSDSLVFGSAVHEMVLQPESFEVIRNVFRPTAKAGLMADELYKKCGKIEEGKDFLKDEDILAASNKINYYKGKMNDNRIAELKEKIVPYLIARRHHEDGMQFDSKEPIYLDAKSLEKLDLCLASVKENQQIQSLLHPEGLIETPISKNEAALFMDVHATDGSKETILKLKGKLDNFTWDNETGELVLNDLKTTGHILSEFVNSFETYHYGRQMAFYLYMLRLYIEKTYGVKPINMKANMLLVSTILDCYAGVYEVTKWQMRKGFKEFRDLLQRVAYYKLNGYNE